MGGAGLADIDTQPASRCDRAALAASCLTFAMTGTAPAATGLGIVKKFGQVHIMVSQPEFSQQATARGWCIGRGYANAVSYRFGGLRGAGNQGYRAVYLWISCIRGVQK